MSRLLRRSALRYHLRHPWQLALALLGVTLGVAVVVAVDVANTSARRAFLLSAEAVTGRATHQIDGGPAGVPASLYRALRVEHGIDSIAPVIDRYIRAAGPGGDRVLRLLGIDPFAERPFRDYIDPASADIDIGVLLTGRTVVLGAATAAELGVATGDSVVITAGTQTGSALVAGVLQPADALSRRALAELAIADIATAQELTGARALDRIELRVSGDAAGSARLDAIRELLPHGFRLDETAAVTGATVRMTRAFETNLTALALVALVFGMFLIYNAVTFSVVQRRALIGLLRAQGVTAGEVTALVLVEALAIGAAATALGVAGGTALGAQLVELVARTINDLYFTVTVTSVELSAATLAKALLLGVGGTLAAAAIPAQEAAAAAPRRTLAQLEPVLLVLAADHELDTRRARRAPPVEGEPQLVRTLPRLAVQRDLTPHREDPVAPRIARWHCGRRGTDRVPGKDHAQAVRCRSARGEVEEPLPDAGGEGIASFRTCGHCRSGQRQRHGVPLERTLPQKREPIGESAAASELRSHQQMHVRHRTVADPVHPVDLTADMIVVTPRRPAVEEHVHRTGNLPPHTARRDAQQTDSHHQPHHEPPE